MSVVESYGYKYNKENLLWCAERMLRSIRHPFLTTAVSETCQFLPPLLVGVVVARTRSSSPHIHLEVIHGHRTNELVNVCYVCGEERGCLHIKHQVLRRYKQYSYVHSLMLNNFLIIRFWWPGQFYVFGRTGGC